MLVSWICLRIKKSNWSICKRVCKKGRIIFQRRINLVIKLFFVIILVKQVVLGLVYCNKMRLLCFRMQQLVKFKLKLVFLLVKQRLKFVIIRQLSQLLKQVFFWLVRIQFIFFISFISFRVRKICNLRYKQLCSQKYSFFSQNLVLLFIVFSMQVQVFSKFMCQV